jgi:membrane protease YdiL (CAAX protease family)
VSMLSRLLEIGEASEHVPRVALGYLVGLSAAEVTTVLFHAQLGLVLHGTLLVTLMLHSALTWEQPGHKLLFSLAFAPLIRILSLSLPLVGLPLLYWYLVTSVPLMVASVVAIRTLGFSWAGVGLNLRALPMQLLVSLTGLGFGYIEYQILKPPPLARALTWDQLWIPILILMVSTGFIEELIFRGMMQRAATEALGRFGLPYVAVLFAVLHVGYLSVLDVVFVLIVGLFFGWVAARTRSIVGVTLSHGLTNIVLFLVVPLSPVFNPPEAPLAPGIPLPLPATPTPAITVPVTPTVGLTLTPAASGSVSASKTPGVSATLLTAKVPLKARILMPKTCLTKPLGSELRQLNDIDWGVETKKLCTLADAQLAFRVNGTDVSAIPWLPPPPR